MSSESRNHHDKAKRHLSDVNPPDVVTVQGQEETRVWRISKLLRSLAYSALSISQQALFIAQNTRDIADQLEDISVTLREQNKNGE